MKSSVIYTVRPKPVVFLFLVTSITQLSSQLINYQILWSPLASCRTIFPLEILCIRVPITKANVLVLEEALITSFTAVAVFPIETSK